MFRLSSVGRGLRLHRRLLAFLAVLTLPLPARAVKITLSSVPANTRAMLVTRFGVRWIAYGNTVRFQSLAGDGSEDTYTLTGGLSIVALAEGPDGTVWAADRDANKIWEIHPGLTIGHNVPTAASQPFDLVVGPDGDVWFTEYAGNKIGRYSNVDGFTEYPITGTPGSHPMGIALCGSSPFVWFVENTGNKLGSVYPPTGAITEYPLPTAGAFPVGLAGSYDALAFTQGGINAIGRFYPLYGNIFDVFDIPIPTASASPQALVFGSDNAWWFTEGSGNNIGRLPASSYTITEYPIPQVSAAARDIARGFGSELWFTAEGATSIGRIDLSIPGDVNGDGSVTVTDVFYLINFLFAGGSAPK